MSEDRAAPLRVAYLVNQYPKVSHSFIRREILALEEAGTLVERFAVRGWADAVADPQDETERGRTRYLLQDGALGLLRATGSAFLRDPGRFIGALRKAVALSRNAERGLLYHLIYLSEAALLSHWLRSLGTQHLHAHFGTNSATVALLAHELGGPGFSFTVHGPEEFDKPVAIALAQKISASRFVVAISSYGRSQLFRWVPQTQWPKVRVVHCGLEAAFHTTPNQVPLHPQAARQLVCVGRLCEQKGQLLLVEAMSMLHQRGIEFEMVLAGDGEMRPVIEARATELGLRERLRITGWIGSEQVRDELLKARAMVLPSFAEGLPVVIMEAMALRRPVISTYVAGIPELVQQGKTGWLIAAGDVTALAEAMQTALSAPQQALSDMGTAAYARVIERHDIVRETTRLRNYMIQAVEEAETK